MKIKLVSIFILISISINAQRNTHQNNIWLHLVEKVKINDKFGCTFEGTFRFANGFEQPQQFFVRPSLDYKLSKKFVLSLGYTYYNTYSYGAVPMNKMSIPEHHIWIQGQYMHKWCNWTIQHRLRDENRMVGVVQQNANNLNYIDHFEYRNRVRYMFLLTYPLLKKENKTILNGIVGNEIFLNIGSFSGASILNQNRIIAGLGYVINPKMQFQFCYIHQNLRNKANTIEEINPTLRVSFVQNLNF